MTKELAVTLALLLVSLHADSAHGDKCTAKKLKAVAKKEAGLLNCRSKAVKKGDASLLAPCVVKVEDKYAAAFAKAGSCGGNQNICECLADACDSAVAAILPDGGPSKCEAVRLKAAGKKASAKLNCNAKAAVRDEAVDTACIQKAEAKFTKAFANTSGCTGDPATVEDTVDDECVSAVGADAVGGMSVGAICQTCNGVSTTTSTTTTSTTNGTVTTTTIPCPVPVVPPLKVVAVNATAVGFAPYAIQPPGSTDWYIVEQVGRIKIIRGGAVLPTSFLDITGAIGSSLGERGLLSVAFHPSYATNGRFFTMATPADGNDGTYAPTSSDAVVEWSRSATNADVANGTKVRDIVVLEASATNHNGGTAKFGPDDYLYVATGDGGGGCESSKPGQVQDVTKLFGKVLRLDVDGSAPFAAPGNPFASDARVYHYGLRNPFRFNFDPVTTDLYIGDVGQGDNEEISLSPANAAAKNFGWPAFEGDEQATCGANPLGGPSPHTPPILSIDRTAGSTSPFKDYAAIVGGAVYRGSAIPQLDGVYFFADFYGAELGALRYCGGGLVSQPVAIPLSSIPVNAGALNAISSFVEGNDGELYLTYGNSTRIGRIELQ